MATYNGIPVGSLNNKRGAGMENNNDPTKKQKPEHQDAVVQGASKEKKSLGKKFKETFVKEDMKSVAKNLWTKKIFPDIISMVRDTIWDGITMHFGLGGSRGGYTQGSRPGYTNYQAASVGPTYSYSGNPKPAQQGAQQKKPEAPNNWRDICYTSEEDAVKVLNMLRMNATEYDGYSEVADLIEFSGFTVREFTDHDWGWSTEMLMNVSNSPNRRYIDGEIRYFLDLPDPISVKS